MLLAGLTLWAVPVQAAVVFVQSKVTADATAPWSAAAAGTVTMDSDCTVGNTLIVLFGIEANENLLSVTDDGSGGTNTYATEPGNGLNVTSAIGIEIWTYWAPCDRAGNVITVTFDSTNVAQGYIRVLEFSGLNNSDLLEDFSTFSTAGANDTTLDGGAVTTTVADSVVVVEWYGTNGVYSGLDGYTAVIVNNTNRDAVLGYRIFTSTQASEEWNLGADAPGEQGSSTTAAFNGSAGGGGGSPLDGVVISGGIVR